MRDDEWLEIERELKRRPRPDPTAVDRVMRRIEEAAPPSPALRSWRWLVRPRTVAVSPLVGLLAAAVVAGILALPWLVLAPEERGGPDPLAGVLPPPGAPTASGSREPLQQVQFVLVASEASRVALVGDFNDWDPQATPLRKSGEEGIWSAVVPLRSGRYLYAFVVDGSVWVTDDAAPMGPETSFGSNSVILVGDGR